MRVGGGAAAGVGSGVAQASFEPQASMLVKVEKVLAVDICEAGAGLGGCSCVGDDRLKAPLLAYLLACMGGGDFAADIGAAVDLGGGAGAAAIGEPRLKRSPMPLVAADAGGLLVLDGEAKAVEKSPKSPPKLSLRGACEGGEVAFGGGAGFVSKKLPPDNGLGLLDDVCRV